MLVKVLLCLRLESEDCADVLAEYTLVWVLLLGKGPRSGSAELGVLIILCLSVIVVRLIIVNNLAAALVLLAKFTELAL